MQVVGEPVVILLESNEESFEVRLGHSRKHEPTFREQQYPYEVGAKIEFSEALLSSLAGRCPTQTRRSLDLESQIFVSLLCHRLRGAARTDLGWLDHAGRERGMEPWCNYGLPSAKLGLG